MALAAADRPAMLLREEAATEDIAGIAEGEMLSIDGETGAIFAGALGVEAERPSAALAKIGSWRGTPAHASA